MIAIQEVKPEITPDMQAFVHGIEYAAILLVTVKVTETGEQVDHDVEVVDKTDFTHVRHNEVNIWSAMLPRVRNEIRRQVDARDVEPALAEDLGMSSAATAQAAAAVPSTTEGAPPPAFRQAGQKALDTGGL